MVLLTARRRMTGNRRGLAPLELTIALPLFLFILALMIDFAYVAAWKVRGSSVARHQLWANRYPRSLKDVPDVTYWPTSASRGMGGAADAGSTDLNGSLTGFPVMALRGPMPGAVTIKPELLDANRGFQIGTASMVRDFALLSKRLGTYSVWAHTTLMDSLWQFQRMDLSQNADPRLLPLVDEPTSADDSVKNYYKFDDVDPEIMQKTTEATQTLYENYTFNMGDSVPRSDTLSLVNHPQFDYAICDEAGVEEEVEDVKRRIEGL